ncbi:UV DNA damage repair endonuclease UvsE [Candidatus Woesearchaeota archaeon]|nr:UV DNA damage repair endonuclease UvsE [Candidatus Woesearchaeota archaeon]
MKIGYPCINRSIGCTANTTFRLKNYSKENLIEKVSNNLDCLMRILRWNVDNGVYFFRISSDLIPFASHPVCRFDWGKHFKKRFEEVGRFIHDNSIRISMHPDQFVLINALDKDIVRRSVKELEYHCRVLDLMKLGRDAKVQIHVGGVYGDKGASIRRFVENYKKLPLAVKKRLVIENDHRSYSLKDCTAISDKIKIPTIFDTYHHECLNNGERLREAILKARKTWSKNDGKLMIDYSNEGNKKGSHSEHIDIKHFMGFLKKVKGIDFDIMLEIKDKERSALEAVKCIR